MIIKTKVRLIKYNKKDFTNDKGQLISYNEALIEDSEANRFKVSVAKENVATLGIEVSSETIFKDGEVELQLMPFEKSGRTYLKLSLISFKLIK